MCFAVYKFYPHKAIYWSLWNLRSGSLRSWDWLLENSRVIVLKSYLCLLPRQSQILVSANFSYLLVFLTIVTHLKYCYNVCYKKQLQHWHDAWNFPSSCLLACHGRVTMESSVTAGGVTTMTVEVDRSPAAAEMTLEGNQWRRRHWINMIRLQNKTLFFVNKKCV